MKHLLILLMTVITVSQAIAQKIDYKNNIISVDGKETVKVTKIKDKESFGLTSTFEVSSMTDKKLIIATVATEFHEDRSNSSMYYYKLTFLTTDQVGIFEISKFGPEKSFVKLIGGSGIFANDDVDPAKVKEFMALKGKIPSAQRSTQSQYTLVVRQRGWPIKLQDDKTITQNSKVIGSFKEIPPLMTGYDSYEISLPTEVVVAVVSFKGGNNAQDFDLTTQMDGIRRIQNIPTRDRVALASAGADKNEIALKRLVEWLVNKNYL
jgi:hypothetical protein